MSFKEKIAVVGKEDLKTGEIPSILVWGQTLPEVWENAVLATWEHGTQIPTQYDQPEDPESCDATVMMTVASPFGEPRIHKALPCGLDELWVYTQEVVAGIHDSRVGPDGWSYSYHDRLTNWPGIGNQPPFIDQIETIGRNLAETPHSRRAQAITWYPPVDASHHEPPCLQRIWCRVVKSGADLYLLVMNTHWRSRDGFKAAFMNMYALTELQRLIAQKISKLSGHQVETGRYVDISDSFHIYGSYIRKGELENFLQQVQNRSFEQRTFKTGDEQVQAEFKIGQERLTGGQKIS